MTMQTLAAYAEEPGVGTMFWLDAGEENDGNIVAVRTENADRQLIAHDGSMDDILTQIREIHAYAVLAAAESEPPVVLVINSISQIWATMKAAVSVRALLSDTAAAAWAADPDADIQPHRGHWREANAWWKSLVELLLTFPGVVLLTARAEETQTFGDDGKPEPTLRWRTDFHFDLQFQVTAMVRMRGSEVPELTVVHSSATDRVPSKAPVPCKDLTVAQLVSEYLGVDLSKLGRRSLYRSPEVMALQMLAARTMAALESLNITFTESVGFEHPVVQAAYERRSFQLQVQDRARQLRLADDEGKVRTLYTQFRNELGNQPMLTAATKERLAELHAARTGTDPDAGHSVENEAELTSV
ncbi:hypothetical protein ACWDUL_20160 [Nocardia niigatensis]